jgi:hypothetical protein
MDDSQLAIHDRAQLDQTRAALVSYLFGDRGFPAREMPASVQLGVASPITLPEGTCTSVDEYQIDLEQGFRSFAFHFHPAVSAHKLMIFHHGHEEILAADGGAQSIAALLQQGYDVIALYMLNYGPNLEPLSDHYQIVSMDPAGGASPLRFFLEPVAVVLNHALSTARYRQVAMLGISGGGWTATVYPAIDPRIQLSFPVAGSLPLYLRTNPRDQGDAEQYLHDFYQVAGYPDLYLLASAGQGRQQIQVLNQFDDCCFARDPDQLDYRPRVQERLAQIDTGGSFDARVDVGQVDHAISDWTIGEVIDPALASAPEGCLQQR